MKKLITLISFFLAFANLQKANGQNTVYTIGPMIHFNISDDDFKPSFGIEAAYWNISGFPYSIDLGIDFEKKIVRIYSELQTGIGVAGLSLGPYVQFKKESTTTLGVQGSLWANYYLGFDLRFRSGKNAVFAPGIYAKVPFGPGVWEEDDGESDWDDWD